MSETPPDARNDKRASHLALVSLATVLLLIVALALVLERADDPHGETTVPPAPTLLGDDGFIRIEAVGYADPRSVAGNELAAALEADARRRLVEKAAALYMVPELLDFRHALVGERLLARADGFVRKLDATAAAQRTGGGLTALAVAGEVDARGVRTALLAIGKDEDLRLLRHGNEDVPPAIERIRLRMLALPKGVDTALLQDFAGLRSVLAIFMARGGGSAQYELDLSGDDGFSDPIGLVAQALLAPMQARFGRNCLGVNSRHENEVTLAWDAACNHPDILARIEAQPPAAVLASMRQAPAEK